MKKIDIQYDERAGTAVATIAGNVVRFRGSHEGAERFFASLAARANDRGLLYSDEADLSRVTAPGSWQ